jgi:fumarate reductase flavoprotein subunit
MPETTVLSCDVAVVGAGISGMISAVRSAQGGRRVIVFEKTTDERYVCNSRLTAGIWHCCQMDVLSDPGGLEAKIPEVTGGARPDSPVPWQPCRSGNQVHAKHWHSIYHGPDGLSDLHARPPTITPQAMEGRGGMSCCALRDGANSSAAGSCVVIARCSWWRDNRITGFTGELATGGRSL